MKPDEETSLVQLAVQHAHLRESNSVAAFAYEVGVSFQAIHGWQFKSVARKLTDMERNWRVTLGIEDSAPVLRITPTSLRPWRSG
jgi:hypothetical protein